MERSTIIGRPQPSMPVAWSELRRRVPGPRAGGLPERRHERPGAGAARSRRPRRRSSEQVESGRSGKPLVRAPDRAHRRAARRAWRTLLRLRRPPRWRSPARRPTASTPSSLRSTSEPGDEVLTSDEEHPGVLAPARGRARQRAGVEVRVVPFAELAGRGRRPHTSWSACSHVSWATGRGDGHGRRWRRPACSVLLDGAQGLGAVPLDVRALGCDFYAASGQKWLCGPDGIGYLYVRRGARAATLPRRGRGYHVAGGRRARARAGPSEPDARRFDHGLPRPAPRGVGARVARRARGGRAGDACPRARATALAGTLAGMLAETRRDGGAAGRTRRSSPSACRTRRARGRRGREGIVMRDLPGTPYVRASVGAWNSDEETRAAGRGARL